ncbi:hypothetical protein TNIN_345461 [Trichonephila inaurata madagascariensis]|uniref:Secreted protein n=1 Tax=Trichonephila inaurata madagascariensis TaxID=2747483 RepID=A0A8X6YE03_9ARAC|nr:hypothetical protein TNIN_345461 [Trichonephila inaurata madagascariensis]
MKKSLKSIFFRVILILRQRFSVLALYYRRQPRNWQPCPPRFRGNKIWYFCFCWNFCSSRWIPPGALGAVTRFAADPPQQPSRTIGVGRSGYVGTCEFWADLSPPTRGLSAAVH